MTNIKKENNIFYLLIKLTKIKLLNQKQNISQNSSTNRYTRNILRVGNR